jgi:hypothetical protein
VEVDALMNHIWLEYDEVRKHCLRKQNPKASVLSIVLQTIEHHLILALDKFMAENGRYMDVLIHDGGLVRKLDGETEFPTSLLRCAEEFLLCESGYELRLAMKPIDHSYDLKPETVYVAEGVSMDDFLKRKEEFERAHFYLRENGSICEIRKDGTLNMMEQKLATANLSNNVFEFKKESIIKRVPFLPLWMTSSDRREYNRLVYSPSGVCESDEYNTFLPLVGNSLPFSDGADGLARFLEIALNLVNGNMEHREYLLKWIALKLQKPWVVPGVCLVFTGDQGVGKSLLWTMIGEKIIGRNQFVYSTNIANDVFDKHSEAQNSNLLCIMEEASSNITHKMANELKAKITSTLATINPKYIRAFTISTFMSWVMLTNDSTPVKLETGDRRYCVFHTGAAHKGDSAYWKETVDMFGCDEVVGTIYKYLMDLDLSDFIVTKFPVTELREVMMEAERPVEEMFLREVAGDLEGDEWCGTNQEFYRLYIEWCRKYDIRSKSAVGLGRDLTPYVMKGWLCSYKNDALLGKKVHLNKIKSSQ